MTYFVPFLNDIFMTISLISNFKICKEMTLNAICNKIDYSFILCLFPVCHYVLAIFQI